MIDRRRFVQSMLALGAATGVRPSTILLARPPADELRDLADAALSAARRAGASYADIRINRYRNQFIFTRDRRVQNIVNTEDYGFGVRVIAEGTWGFASSSNVTKEEIARVAASGRRDCKANKAINAEPVRLAPVESYDGTWNTPVAKNPFEMPLQPKLDLLLQIHEEALKVPGASFVSASMQFVNEHKYFASTEGSHIEQSLIRSYPSFSVTAVDRRVGQVLLAQLADGADGNGLRVRRVLPAPEGSASRRRGGGRDAQGEAGPGRAEDVDPPSDQPLADDPRVGRPSDGARSSARLRGELRGHQLPHDRQARQVRVRLEDREHHGRQDAGARRWRPAVTTTMA